MEEWKDVAGFEHLYQVSDLGRFRSIKKNRRGDGIITPFLHQHRICVALKKEGANYRLDLTRLVADNFLPESYKGQWLEHIDGNKFNNAASNIKCSGITEKEYFRRLRSESHLKGENKCRIEGKYAYVEIGDKEMICDAEDWLRLKKYRWNVVLGYAVANGGKLRFHREVMNPPDDMVIDHINLNRLDNRKENLRITTTRVNNINRAREYPSTTRFRGVSVYRNKYRVTIRAEDKRIFLGDYDTFEEAKQVRLEAEIKYHKPIIEKETLQTGCFFNT